MVEPEDSIEFEERDVLRLERSLLKDNAAELLRDYIVSGRVGSGAKLVERQVSAALGVSRMPIRDAMIKLEQQGLVVSRPSGRFVIAISEREARQLNQVRSSLEYLAVQLAVDSMAARETAMLELALHKMRKACATRDRVMFVRADLEIHDAIWQASSNPYLQKTLTTILGPLQVAVSNSAETFDWAETLTIHEDLVRRIVARDRDGAMAAMRTHMESITR
ncbi:MAG: GntR family transcriptional regulator [Devosia sp.]|nr:GntR family transcriptional regulator [Devosia sp.]